MEVVFTSLLTSPLMLVLVTAVVLVLFLRSKRRDVTNLPPGPRGWEALWSVLSSLQQGDLHTKAETWSRRYGELVLCRSVLGDMCFLNSARLVRKVFASKELEAFTNDRPVTFVGWFATYNYRDIATTGPSQSPHWSKMRKLFHYAVKFYGDGVEQMESTIQTELQRLVTELETSSGQDIDVTLTLSNSLLCVVGVLMTGERYQPDSPLLKAIKKLNAFINDIFNPATEAALVAFPWLRFVPLLRYKSICDGTIAARDEAMSLLFTAAKNTRVSGKPRGIIDVMLDEQSKGENSWMSDDYIMGAIFDTLAGAYTTSLQTLKGAFLYLTHKPEMIRSIQKEIDENIGARLPCLKDRSNLPFTEAFVSETLRHSSVIALGVAHATSDDITVDNYTIPKGTTVFSNTLALHHDPEVFPDPECFRPERFLDNRGHLLPANHPLRQSLLPFSVGKRSCPGEAFARSRIFLYITTLLQKFDILPPVNHQLPPDTRSSWKSGIALDLHPYHLVFQLRS